MKRKHTRLVSMFMSAVMAASVLTAAAAPAAAVQQDDFAARFENITEAQRPKTRWWVPGSHMTVEEIRKEIKSMAEAGFGGAEIVPVATSGEGGSGIDWGTEQWNYMIKNMLEIAGEYDFTIDFTMTPAWPLALPTVKDLDDPSSGAQLETDGAWVDGITAENPYNGAVPVIQEAVNDTANGGTPVLLAVTVAKYTDKAKKTLSYDSARTLPAEALVKGEGPTDYTVSFTPEDDGEYVLYAWWQHPSGEQKYGNNQLDHFGKAGSQALIEYWEENLIPYYGEAFKNCSALFVDSLEFTTHLDWTWGLLEDFEARYGYDITPYLAGVYQARCSGNYSGAPKPDFKFDRLGDQVQNDFRDELTQLYIENHLEPLSAFCEKHGIKLRYQTSYGKSLELAQTAMHVGIPETETLYGKDIIDFYRLQSGAVHLTDKEIYSIEASPEYLLDLGFFQLNRGNGEESASNYQQTWDAQLWHIQRAFAGGVNQIVFHGYSYNGQYEGEGNVDGYLAGTQWPGFEGFGSISSFSNSWGERQPNWLHANSYTDFIGRNQMVLREGTAKVDLAICDLRYWETIDYSGASKVYKDNSALEHSGYTYDFVSPAAFELDNAVVTNGRLDAEGPAYKAILLDKETAIAQAAAEKLLAYAEAGLPVIFVGSVPTVSAFSGEDTVADIMAQLQTYDCVKLVAAAADVPAALAELGVQPDAKYDATLFNVHRQSENADFYYLYNDANADDFPKAKAGAAVETTVTLAGDGVPYELNAWTGEVTAVAQYTVEDGAVNVPVELASNESTILVLAQPGWCGIAAPKAVVTSENVTAEFNAEDGLLVKSELSGQQEITLSDSSKLTLDFGEVQAETALTGWNLKVESWSKGETPTDTKKEVIDVGTLESMIPWNEIEGMEKVSGVGTYTTSFELERGWEDGFGAVINLGDVVDTYALTVNGQTVVVDQINTSVDIGRYLVAGKNTVTVEVTSTLLNAVLAANPTDSRKPDQYGILNEVTLTPYEWRVAADTVTVNLSGESDVTVEAAELSYDVSVADAKNLATATLVFELTGLGEAAVTPAEGWYIIEQRYEAGTLKAILGNNAGMNGEGVIATLTAATTGEVGTASVALTQADLSAYVGEGETFANVILGTAAVETVINYHPCDVNQDGKVNQLDITRAQRFFGTADEICDVNADGVVNTADMILILNNYTV